MKIQATNKNIYSNHKVNNSQIAFGISFAKIKACAARELEFMETEDFPKRLSNIFKIKKKLRELKSIKPKDRTNSTEKEIECNEWNLEIQARLMKNTPSN